MPILYEDISGMEEITPFNPIPIVPFNYTQSQLSMLGQCQIDDSKPSLVRPSIMEKSPDASISILNPPNGICKNSLLPGSLVIDNPTNLEQQKLSQLKSFNEKNKNRFRGYYSFPVDKSCKENTTPFYNNYFSKNSNNKSYSNLYLVKGDRELTNNSWNNFNEVNKGNRDQCNGQSHEAESSKDQVIILPSKYCVTEEEFNDMPYPKYDPGNNYQQIDLKHDN